MDGWIAAHAYTYTNWYTITITMQVCITAVEYGSAVM